MSPVYYIEGRQDKNIQKYKRDPQIEKNKLLIART